MTEASRRSPRFAEFFAIPQESRFHELIGGEITRKATPSAEHGDAQAGIVSPVRVHYHGPPGPGRGGWWIATEVEVELDTGEIVRPDVPGWRRVDPRDATLTVMRWADAGWVTVLRAERGDTVHPEPFEAIELVVGSLFGDA